MDSDHCSLQQKPAEAQNTRDPEPGFLFDAGSQVPAPVYFEQSNRLLKVRNLILNLPCTIKTIFQHKFTNNLQSDRRNKIYFDEKALRDSRVLPDNAIFRASERNLKETFFQFHFLSRLSQEMHSKTYQKFQTWKSASVCTVAENLPVTLFISLQV